MTAALATAVDGGDSGGGVADAENPSAAAAVGPADVVAALVRLRPSSVFEAAVMDHSPLYYACARGAPLGVVRALLEAPAAFLEGEEGGSASTSDDGKNESGRGRDGALDEETVPRSIHRDQLQLQLRARTREFARLQAMREERYYRKLPLHVSTDPSAIRSLIEAYPEGVRHRTILGHLPLHRATANRGAGPEAVRALMRAWRDAGEVGRCCNRPSCLGALVRDVHGKTPLGALWDDLSLRLRSSGGELRPDDDEGNAFWEKIQIIAEEARPVYAPPPAAVDDDKEKPGRQTSSSGEGEGEEEEEGEQCCEGNNRQGRRRRGEGRGAENAGRGAERPPDRPERNKGEVLVLHSLLALGGGCPVGLLRYATARHPDQIHRLDERGRTALHVAAGASSASSSSSSLDAPSLDAFRLLLGTTPSRAPQRGRATCYGSAAAQRAAPHAASASAPVGVATATGGGGFPGAAATRDTDGMLPLHEAARAGRSMPILRELIAAYPDALNERCGGRGGGGDDAGEEEEEGGAGLYYPFALAALAGAVKAKEGEGSGSDRGGGGGGGDAAGGCTCNALESGGAIETQKSGACGGGGTLDNVFMLLKEAPATLGNSIGVCHEETE